MKPSAISSWFRLLRFAITARVRLWLKKRLDQLEDWATRRQHVRLTFALLALKRRLGLPYER